MTGHSEPFGIEEPPNAGIYQELSDLRADVRELRKQVKWLNTTVEALEHHVERLAGGGTIPEGEPLADNAPLPDAIARIYERTDGALDRAEKEATTLPIELVQPPALTLLADEDEEPIMHRPDSLAQIHE